VAQIQTQLAAEERIFLLPEVSKDMAGSGWKLYSPKLDTQLARWGAVKAADTESAKGDDNKEAYKARVAADELAEGAITAYQTFIKDEAIDVFGALEKADEKTAWKVDATKYATAEAAYLLDYVKATRAQLKESIVLDADNKKKYEDYDAFLLKLEPSLKKAAEEAAAAAAVEEGGSLLWLWGLLIGLAAVVGIFCAYKQCKKKDEKDD